MNMSANEVKTFMAANLRQFQPIAYFDKHMDCIRVLIQDVSVTEERLNQYFTVARPNGSQFGGRHVGFTIKGVAHLFNEVGLPVTGVHALVEIMDKIVKELPHTAVKQIAEEFAQVMREKKLSVNFDEPEHALAA